MASRSGTANGANGDVERAYGSGRRAKRYGAVLVCGVVRSGTACDTVLSGTACDTVWIGTACVLTDRDDERYGADLDGVCEGLRIDDLRAEREVVRYELTTTYERDALRAGRRTN